MKQGRREEPVKRLRRLLRFGALALAGLAVAQELRKAPETRDWHGSIGGMVPYDFRRPTWDRFRRAYWNPEDDRVLMPTAFGVGWAVNFPALGRRTAGVWA